MGIWGSGSNDNLPEKVGRKERVEREEKRRNKIVWGIMAAVLALVLLAVGVHALEQWKQEKQEQERIEQERIEQDLKEAEEDRNRLKMGAPKPKPEDYAYAFSYAQDARLWTLYNEHKETHHEYWMQEWEQWKYWDEHPDEYQEYLEEQERERQREEQWEKEREEYYKNLVLDPIDPSEEEPPDPYDYTTATGYAGNEEDWFAEHGYADPYAAAEEYWDDHCYEYEQGEDG